MTTKVKPAETAATRERGRPSKFTEALAKEICDRLSDGEPLAKICRDEHMPHPNNVREWMSKDPSFSGHIAQARKIGGEAIVDRLRETARGRGDSTGDVKRDKLIVDTDLKLLAKWFPSDYGDKLSVDQTTRVTPMTDEQLRDELKQSPAFRRELEELLASSAE